MEGGKYGVWLYRFGVVVRCDGRLLRMNGKRSPGPREQVVPFRRAASPSRILGPSPTGLRGAAGYGARVHTIRVGRSRGWAEASSVRGRPLMYRLGAPAVFR